MSNAQGNNKRTTDNRAKSGASGFESLSLRSQSPENQGFVIKENQLGQKGGQRRAQKVDFVSSIVKKTLKTRTSVTIPPYKLPAKVYIGPNEWHVEYWYWSLLDSKYKRDKVRLGIRGLSPEAKVSMLNKVCDELNVELKARNQQLQYHDERKLSAEDADRTFLDWVLLAKDDQKLAEERRKVISKVAHNLKEFHQVHPMYAALQPHRINGDVVGALVEYLEGKERTGKTINDIIWGIEKVTEWLAKKTIIPAAHSYTDYRVERLKNETGKFPPLTHEEKQRAFNYFRESYPEYYLFLLSVYYTCIRGSELHRLQVKLINMRARTIHIPWWKSKNGLSNHIQILEPFHQALISAGIDKMHPDTYIFGPHCKPSKVSCDNDYSFKHWYRHRKHMDMPAEKQLYGLKHTFNVDYVENNKYNIDWEWLRRHNRHATVQQTQEYISGLTAYFLDETKSIIINYHNEIEIPQPV